MYDQSGFEVATVYLVFMSWVQSNTEEGRDTNLVTNDSNCPSARTMDTTELHLVCLASF